jgi:hypothetical protein
MMSSFEFFNDRFCRFKNSFLIFFIDGFKKILLK